MLCRGSRLLFLVALLIGLVQSVHASNYGCKPGEDCLGQQLCRIDEPVRCAPGYLCTGYQYTASGAVTGSQPEMCPKGYYCPDGSKKIKCPENYFCPPGASRPRKCSPISMCPEGTAYENAYLGALITVLVSGLFLAAVFFVSRFTVARMRRNANLDKHQSTGLVSLNQDEGGLESRFAIVMDKVSLTLGGKVIVRDLSLNIRSHRSVAVLGPSGAGKTTIISLLLGKLRPTTGQIMYNGTAWDVSKFSGRVGYVPQADTLISVLTPREILLYALEYRVVTDKVTQRMRLRQALTDLGLGHVRHSLIGDEHRRGISGGQRKRVNIGLELVADPKILVLDEPTTGLDSTSSQEVCECLSRIARSGKLVAAVIHQPRVEAFEMFDDLILLGRGGALVYAGPLRDALPYFGQLGYICPDDLNPADFLIDLVSDKIARSSGQNLSVLELADIWTSKQNLLPISVPEHEQIHESSVSARSHLLSSESTVVREPSPSVFQQFTVFLSRSMLQVCRDWKSLAVSMFIHFLGGFVIGTAANPDNGDLYLPPYPSSMVRTACPAILLDRCESLPLTQDGLTNTMFYCCLAAGVASVCRSVTVLGDEIGMIKRESLTGRSLLAYYLAKCVAEIPVIFVGVLVYASVYYSEAVPNGNFNKYFWSFLVMAVAGSGFGYCVSLVVSKDAALSVGIVSAIAFSVCSGSKPTLKEVRDSFPFLEFIWALSFARWGGEALYITEVDFYKREGYSVSGGYDFLGYNQDNFALDLWMAVLLGVGFRILAFVCLWRLQKK